MIIGLLLRHYKNYRNLRFVPIADSIEHPFSIYIGNNGVGKSAILESLNVVWGGQRQWNVTLNEKKTDSYICPLFLIPKSSVSVKVKTDLDLISSFFWGDEPDQNANVAGTPALKEFVDYKNALKDKYSKTHYFVLMGVQYDSTSAFFGSYNKNVLSLLGSDEDEQTKRANTIKDYVLGLYSFMYIPVEESPANLLQLQNETMQKLLNKDILREIERILNQNQVGSPIVDQINRNLDSFLNEVNKIISSIDSDYSFAPENGNKKRLTAKDIRTKIIEAYFPLRMLKVNNRRIDLLSSGEQRKAIIDVAYSTLMANRDKKTDKNIVLAIDEPEISMHISNCYDQFSRLEELSQRGIQILVTTHWYGYLPIAQNGNMHYLELKDNQTKVSNFNLYSLMEKRGDFPDDVDMKSMFDLGSSLISYMRRSCGDKWIICEGSDDKIYLETILKGYKNYHIIPLGGCGNVIKLFQILYGFMTEKSEGAKADVLFLIDTDLKRIPVSELNKANKTDNVMLLRRLQIEDNEIKLLNPASGGTYEQTEIEDCLNPKAYYDAIGLVISSYGNKQIKDIWSHYELNTDAKRSRVRGDNSCIRVKNIKYIDKKQKILEFIESDKNKYLIAEQYMKNCDGKSIEHSLGNLIADQLGLESI